MRMALRVALLVLWSSVAAADVAAGIQTAGPVHLDGRHELTGHLGYQAAFGGRFGNPSGFLIAVEYGHLLVGPLWLSVEALGVVGGGTSVDYGAAGKATLSGDTDGSALGVIAGVKLKFSDQLPFLRRFPLSIETPIGVGAVGMFHRLCGDNGAALVVRTGVQVRWFIVRNLGVGIGGTVAVGPGFHGDGDCRPYGAYTDFYGAVDVEVGAEWVL